MAAVKVVCPSLCTSASLVSRIYVLRKKLFLFCVIFKNILNVACYIYPTNPQKSVILFKVKNVLLKAAIGAINTLKLHSLGQNMY